VAPISKFTIERNATVPITALSLVRQDTATTVTLATSQGTYTDARVIGLALNSALVGEVVEVMLFGIASHPSFNFSINEPLFLTTGGAFSSTAPSVTGQFIVEVGFALGLGEINLAITSPVEIL